jgi:hypothetical protein
VVSVQKIEVVLVNELRNFVFIIIDTQVELSQGGDPSGTSPRP